MWKEQDTQYTINTRPNERFELVFDGQQCPYYGWRDEYLPSDLGLRQLFEEDDHGEQENSNTLPDSYYRYGSDVMPYQKQDYTVFAQMWTFYLQRIQ